jgi:hypothetical protein
MKSTLQRKSQRSRMKHYGLDEEEIEIREKQLEIERKEKK